MSALRRYSRERYRPKYTTPRRNRWERPSGKHCVPVTISKSLGAVAAGIRNQAARRLYACAIEVMDGG
jgi:hypothetical protein